MKNKQKYLQKLYAILLLAVASLSIVPVNLFHRHGGEYLLISGNFAEKEYIAPGHQAFCPVCSCIVTQHSPPACVYETLVYSFPFFHAAPRQHFYVPADPISISPRGPPVCSVVSA